MEAEKITQIANKAAEFVQNVPEEFRASAFEVIFSRMLDPHPFGTLQAESIRRSASKLQINENNREEMMKVVLHTDVDFSTVHDIIVGGTWIERVMLLLWILEDQLGITSLTPPEVAAIMTSKLRLPSVYAPNIGRAITGNMSYFVRSEEGNAYKYSLSSKGLAYVRNLKKS